MSRSFKGSAVRINGNKPKGKNKMKEKNRKKKLQIPPSGFEPSTWPNLLQRKKWGLRPQGHVAITKLLSSAIRTVWTLWCCIYHEFKDTIEEK